MQKKQLVLFLIVLIAVSSGFSLLGISVAGKALGLRGIGAGEEKTGEAVYEKSVPGEEPPQVKPDYILTATAYSDRGETKSRIHAGVGSVAVDTRLIPHGTLLYIEDYGLAVATDTGRLIKGEMIDLWFSDTEKAKNWGRKTVKVWKVGQADLKKILSTGGKYIKY